MTVRFAVSIVGLLCTSSLANAREVQLLSFDNTNVEGAPVFPSPSPGRASSAMDNLAPALSAGFHELPFPPLDDFPSVTATMSIPLWVQSGVSRTIATPPASPFAFSVAYRGQGCGDLSYRPRYDLPASTEARRSKLFPLVAQVACEAGIPVGLFDALVVQESRYHVGALSPRGARGLTQLMPGTAAQLGVQNSWDPVENLRGGALYLRQQLNEFGRVDLALAAYNAGPGRVRGRLQVPRIQETMNYVLSITRSWNSASRVTTVLPSSGSSMAPARVRGVRFAEVSPYTFVRTSNPR
jgi:hypothetical protein